MKYTLLLLTAMAMTVMVRAQITLDVFVKDAETKEPVAGATILLEAL